MKNKETLEEAAERILLKTVIDGNNSFDLDKDLIIKEDVIKAMIEITKWQAERMYSEEEVMEIALLSRDKGERDGSILWDEWFEKFKKK